MATTVYFPSSGTPPITPSVSGWDNTATSFVRRPLNVSGTKSNTAFSNLEWTVNAAFVDWCTVQYISSKPLAAQTISGTVDFGAMMKSSTTGATFSAIRIWIAQPNGTQRGSDLLFYHTNSNAINSGSYTHEFRDDEALTTHSTIQEGDYLVIEIGVYVTNATSKTIGLKIGDPTANGNVTSDSASTTLAVANCVFSDDIVFVNPPTGLSYAASQGNSVQNEVNVAATNNTPSYSGGENGTETFNVSAGSLPTGITLNSSTGVLSGTPTVVGDYNFTVRVANVAGQSTVNVLYQIYSGTPPDPEVPVDPDPLPEFEGNNIRRRNCIYVVDIGSIQVPAIKPILFGMMITAQDSQCRFQLKESVNGVVVLDVRIEADETRHLDFSGFGGIHLDQTFEVTVMDRVGCAILYGHWGLAINKGAG